MRILKNDVQKPKKLVSPEKRKTPAFKVLFLGIVILIIGASSFFCAFLFEGLIQSNLNTSYRTIQSYSLFFSFIGICLYVLCAAKLKIPIRKTSYYKIKTIMLDELYEPQRKGDYAKTIALRLGDFDDDWSLLSQVRPIGSKILIPQIIVGPNGVFPIWPVGEQTDRKAFNDPGPELKKESEKLENNLYVNVTPLMLFSTPKLLQLYTKKHKCAINTVSLIELEEFLKRSRKKLTKSQILFVENNLFKMIEGTQPSE